MSTTQQPEALAFCWATELAMTQQPVTLSVTEAREVSAEMQRLHAESEMRRTALLDEMQKAARQHAENETLRAKIKAYEDLDEAASDVQLLRMGYAAARLEIESLQARIKTMAEERADELTVAHLDGRMRAGQPTGAMLGEQAELRRLSDCCPELNLSNYGPDDVDELNGWAIEVSQCIDRALAAQPAGAQQPGSAYVAPGVFDALNWVDDFIARCNGDDRGACESVNVLRRAFASHGQAPAQAIGPCVICGSDEPFTGTCGSGGDPRALCKQPAPTPQADSVTAPAATVIKKGAERQWMSERLGHLPDGIYSLYLAPPAQAEPQQEPIKKGGEA